MPGPRSKAAGSNGNIRLDYRTEDELSATFSLSRDTPCYGLAGGSKETLYADLKHLAAVVRKPSTPGRRASSLAMPVSDENVAATTPNTSRTRRPLAQRSNPSTPHGLRAFQQRRATPGRDTRKSGRLQRETPRNALRNLSKVLAPISHPIAVQPSPRQLSTWEQTAEKQLEDESDLPQPRFSIAIDDEIDANDSFGEAPPRLSIPLDGGELTAKSIEVARHAASGHPKGRSSKGSFGNAEPSDQFGNHSAVGLADMSRPLLDESIVQHSSDVDANELGDRELRLDVGDDTEDLKQAIFEPSDRYCSPFSGVGNNHSLLETETPPPFILTVPRFDRDYSLPEDVIQRGVSTDERQHSGQETNVSATLVSVISELTKIDATVKPSHKKPRNLEESRERGPNLPSGVTRKIAMSFLRKLGFRQTRMGKETMKAIIEAGDLYFQQLGGDLSAFANHADRKRIDESDVIAVMRRQRHSSATATPFSLARAFLPAELLREVRLPVHEPSRHRRKRRLDAINEAGVNTDTQ